MSKTQLQHSSAAAAVIAAAPALQSDLPNSKNSQLFLTLNHTQVKINDTLTGEILFDAKQTINTQCSVVLVIESKENIYKGSQIIFEEIIMSVRSEVYQIKSQMAPNIYKIPLNIEISDIFDSSECFRLDNELSVKVEYQISCQIVQFVDQQQQSQAKMINKIQEVSSQNGTNFIRSSDQIEYEGQVLLSSASIPIQIISNISNKKSLPVTITQHIPKIQKSFFRKLGSILCCKGTRENKYKECEANSKAVQKKTINFFCLDINTINIYPGEAFSFIINDDSKISQESQASKIQYKTRLVNKQVININNKTYLNETNILYSKNVYKNQPEKVTLPYSSQNSYKSNVFKNTFELQVVPEDYDFTDIVCLKVPIHVNHKKFRLLPLQNENEYQDQQMKESIELLQKYPCKIIAKISIKFDEQQEEQNLAESQRSTKLNTPDITPLRKSFE
ncbi:hypothetical protein TTHERM_00492470 (macronuclear) [Tetrahymena thermophila SB210]|uniref:Uncharacterized protein n=1 Tax=Tetrahymena thermophila (strain SB210) TaxID=312017 RepID=I7MLQ8_TETTS|nr:hypothetical protein TTHERM_00492470 [Tetrahymena thermophila SB210]EAS02894.1 hypothetical protein TTHERM_00492470 [Tetrahymena thermophila SB210]|eukprot:XP_001023139.1 hypothetical protein TTHERM_00492470 [Tetrahymena thermophila SB210]